MARGEERGCGIGELRKRNYSNIAGDSSVGGSFLTTNALISQSI